VTSLRQRVLNELQRRNFTGDNSRLHPFLDPRNLRGGAELQLFDSKRVP
jgi:hypothetical protein